MTEARIDISCLQKETSDFPSCAESREEGWANLPLGSETPPRTVWVPSRKLPPSRARRCIILIPVTSYVALLRGINVGGSNLIRMVALKACFEAKGFRDVATYIQSGNVLFTASRGNQAGTASVASGTSQMQGLSLCPEAVTAQRPSGLNSA